MFVLFFIHSSAFSLCFIPIILMCSCRILIKITYLLTYLLNYFCECVTIFLTFCSSAIGDRSLSIAGPSLWNSLPVALRDRDISLEQFKRLLKTLWFVYRAAAHSDWCFFAPCINILTYLLSSSSGGRLFAMMPVSVCLSVCDGSALAHYS